jgi:hypothetical protein
MAREMEALEEIGKLFSSWACGGSALWAHEVVKLAKKCLNVQKFAKKGQRSVLKFPWGKCDF